MNETYRVELASAISVVVRIAFNVGGFFIHKPEIAVAALTTLIGWIASGQVSAQITENLPLEGAADAHTMLESRLSTGKLILKPWL